MTESGEVNKQIDILRQRAIDDLPDWGGTAASSVEAFSVSKLVESGYQWICCGFFPSNESVNDNYDSFI